MYVGWLQEGSIAADERAGLRAMLYLYLKRPHQAAHAAACAVLLRGTELAGIARESAAPSRCPPTCPVSDQAMDRLAHAFSLHGRSMLLSSTTISKRGVGGPGGNGERGASSLGQQPHARVVDAEAYQAALCSLFCAAQLCPLNNSYRLALAGENLLMAVLNYRYTTPLQATGPRSMHCLFYIHIISKGNLVCTRIVFACLSQGVPCSRDKTTH